MDEAFPLCFCILKAIKNWTVGRPGNEAMMYIYPCTVYFVAYSKVNCTSCEGGICLGTKQDPLCSFILYLVPTLTILFLSLSSVPAPVCPTPPTSSGGAITVRWNYTHTGGLELTQVIVTATKGVLTTELDVPNGNLTDLNQMYLNISTFTAGFLYTFTVTAYNQLGSSTVQCNPVTHQIGMCQNSLYMYVSSPTDLVIRS